MGCPSAAPAAMILLLCGCLMGQVPGNAAGPFAMHGTSVMSDGHMGQSTKEVDALSTSTRTDSTPTTGTAASLKELQPAVVSSTSLLGGTWSWVTMAAQHLLASVGRTAPKTTGTVLTLPNSATTVVNVNVALPGMEADELDVADVARDGESGSYALGMGSRDGGMFRSEGAVAGAVQQPHDDVSVLKQRARLRLGIDFSLGDAHGADAHGTDHDGGGEKLGGGGATYVRHVSRRTLDDTVSPTPPIVPSPPMVPTPPSQVLNTASQQALLIVLGEMGPNATAALPEWTDATDPCSEPNWPGVQCSVVDGEAVPTTLDLSALGLAGALPPSVSSLTTLTELDFSRNAFTHAIPPGFSALARLAYFGAGSNQLTGTLPDSFSVLANLEQLEVGGNHLTGTLPASWSALLGLQLLNVSTLHVTGTLPQQWSTLSKLSTLDVTDDTNLCGPLDLGAEDGVFSVDPGPFLAMEGSSLNTTCPSPPPPPPPPFLPPPSPQLTVSDDTNIVAIVVPVIICVVLVAAVIAGVVWWKRRRTRRDAAQASSAFLSMGSLDDPHWGAGSGRSHHDGSMYTLGDTGTKKKEVALSRFHAEQI